MAMIRVTMSNLRSTAESLEEMARSMANIVDNLSSTEENLNVSWEGSANDAFHRAFMYDKDFMVMFYQLIQLYSHKLREIAANYERAEQQCADLATRRNGGGGGSDGTTNPPNYPLIGMFGPGDMKNRPVTMMFYASPRPIPLSQAFDLSGIALKSFASPANMG